MLCFLLAAAAAILEHAPVVGARVLARDEAMLFYFGARASGDFLLYRDFWDVPFPGLYYLSAFCFDLSPAHGAAILRLAHLGARLATLPLLLGLWKEHLRPPLACACLLVYAILASAPEIDGRAILAEPFQVLLLAAAMRLLRSRRMLLFGVAAGMAGLFKQSALAFLVLPLFLDPEATGGGHPAAPVPARALADAGRAAVGAAAVVAATALAFTARGALGDAFACTVRYVLFDRSDALGPLESLRQSAILGRIALPVCGPLLLAVLAGLRLPGPRFPRAWWGWLAVAGFLAFGAGRAFPHYVQLLLPPLCGLAGIGAQRLWHGGRRWVLAPIAILLIAQAVCSIRNALVSPAGPSPKLLEIERAIRACSGPDERIFVWGPHPELYVLSNRSAPSRYVGLMPIVGPNVEHAGRPGLPGALDRLLSDLEARPPALIVLAPGMANYDLEQPHLAPLRAWIEASYVPQGKAGEASILRRR